MADYKDEQKKPTWPKDFEDPAKKRRSQDPSDTEDSWLTIVGRNLYYRYTNDGLLFGASSTAKLYDLRDYGNGYQGEWKYQDSWVPKRNRKAVESIDEAKRKGYANLNWDINTPAPMVFRTISALIGTDGQRIQADSLSPTSMQAKAVMKFEAMFDAAINPILAKAGISRPNRHFDFQDIHDLELYEALGGFKINFEMAIEKIAEHGLINVSQWHKKIEPRLKKDLVDLNFITTHDCVSPDGYSMVEYTNTPLYIAAWTDDYGTDKSPFKGVVTKMNAEDVYYLLKENGYEDGEKLEELMKRLVMGILEPSVSQLGLSDYGWYMSRDTVTDRMRYSNLYVDCLKFEYETCDTEYKGIRHRETGMEYYDAKWGVEDQGTRPHKDRSIEKLSYHTVYQGTYIPYCDVAIGGRAEDIKMIDKKTPMLSWHDYKIPGKSITENCKPCYDNIQKLRLKFQNVVNEIKPTSIAVDISGLNISKIGQTDFDPLDIIEVYNSKGMLFYKSVFQGGKYIVQKPFELLPNDVGDKLTQILNAIESEMSTLFRYAGISGVMAMQTQPVEKLATVVEAEQEATVNSLSEHQKALEYIYVESGKAIILNAMVRIWYDEDVRKLYEAIVGPEGIDAIMAAKDLTLQQLAINLTPKVTQQRKAQIAVTIQEAMAIGRDGVQLIDVDEALLMLDLVDKGRVKEAIWYYSRQVNKKKQEASEEAKANSKQQNDQLMALEDKKMQNALMLYQETAKVDLIKEAELQNIKNEGVINNTIAKNKGELKAIELEARLRVLFPEPQKQVA